MYDFLYDERQKIWTSEYNKLVLSAAAPSKVASCTFGRNDFKCLKPHHTQEAGD